MKKMPNRETCLVYSVGPSPWPPTDKGSNQRSSKTCHFLVPISSILPCQRRLHFEGGTFSSTRSGSIRGTTPARGNMQSSLLSAVNASLLQFCLHWLKATPNSPTTVMVRKWIPGWKRRCNVPDRHVSGTLLRSHAANQIKRQN